MYVYTCFHGILMINNKFVFIDMVSMYSLRHYNHIHDLALFIGTRHLDNLTNFNLDCCSLL